MGFFTPSPKKIQPKDVNKAIKSSKLPRRKKEFAAGALRKAAKSGGGLTEKELNRELGALGKDTKDPLRRPDIRKLRDTLEDKFK